MLTAEEARKLRANNTLLQKAIQKGVKYTLENVMSAINNGRDYCSVSCMASATGENGEEIWASREQIFEELTKLGYRRYVKPVYSGGILQQGLFITWL